jgi:hypothetical protein
MWQLRPKLMNFVNGSVAVHAKAQNGANAISLQHSARAFAEKPKI